MKVSIRDSEVLKQIKPSDASTYLTSRGWHCVTHIPEKASIWTLGENNDEYEILLPLNPDFRDFSNRISDILQTLEIVELRSQTAILENLQNVFSDIVNLRLSHDQFRDGTIPLLNGVNFHRYAKDLVLSAACSTVVEKKAFFEKKPNQANSYIEKVRLGQPKLGSYILTILSPIPQSSTTEISPLSQPFARRVMAKLQHSLQFTREYVDHIDASKENVIVTDELLNNGITANLCQSLIGIHKSGRSEGVEVSFNLSPAIADTSIIQQMVSFQPKLMPYVSILGQQLKAYSYQDYEIRGEVFKLERHRYDDTGKVTLLADVDNVERRITIELDEDHYLKASRANISRNLVVCRGNLRQKGRSFVLKNLTEFTIL
jgi:hypothetical protein